MPRTVPATCASRSRALPCARRCWPRQSIAPAPTSPAQGALVPRPVVADAQARMHHLPFPLRTAPSSR